MAVGGEKWLAKQLKGAVSSSILYIIDKWYTQYNELLEYLRTRRLEYGRITTEDLDAIGKLVGITRPYAVLGGEQSLLFSDKEAVPPASWSELHALSDIPYVQGGIFQANNDIGTNVPVSNALYIRFIVNSMMMKQTFSLDSLCNLLDDLVGANAYEMSWLNPADEEAENIGDIYVILYDVYGSAYFMTYLQEAADIIFNTAPRIKFSVR